MSKICDRSNIFSLLAIILIVGISTTITVSQAKWKTKTGVIESDIKGYYAYLPAAFIYGDFQFEYMWDEENKEDIWGKIWFRTTPDEKRLLQYTTGLSICYSPFFFLAHLSAPLLGYSNNGYTLPYEFAVQISALFYLLLGLVFLRKLLIKYFPDYIVALSLLIVVLGTNLIFYTTYEGAMSHVYSFTFVALFLWLLNEWLNKQHWRDAILLGLVTGMVILIRPSNIFIVLLFGLWGVSSWSSIKERLALLLKKWYVILAMVAMALLVWVPQFAYWHEVTGQWFYNSYSGEGTFFWGDPKVVQILFSYRKGWLLYTPFMVLAFLGLPVLYREKRELFLPTLAILLLAVYILSAWCFWWYGGSYGNRAFIDFYALFAIPIAASLHYAFRKRWSMIAALVVVGVFLFHNYFQIQQYRNKAIHFVSMTKEAYWESFGRRWPSDKYWSMLEYPDYEGVRAKVAEKKSRKEKKKNAPE